mmetsp:Transcript_124116/g.247269  ORF Transcript_124116/g.247269 Transcript_124116/m.247269 type:complete len:530 (+) Transcript_124116:51-1640(+)
MAPARVCKQLCRPSIRRGRPQALAISLLICVASLNCASWSFVGLVPVGPTLAPSHLNIRNWKTARASRGGEESTSLQVGDFVQAISPEDDQRYPATIDKINDDGTYSVRWDDPDGGPETDDVAADAIKKVIVFKDYVVGDDVKAASPDDGGWYPGVVGKVNSDGTFQVKWDDPDGGPETNDVAPKNMKKINVFRDYKVGDMVEAVFPEDGRMYEASVLKENSDGTFQVKWQDPDGGPEESGVSPKNMRYPPIPFEKLEVGQKYTGTVVSIMDFGAFVNIGADTDGLLHISRIRNERVEDINDVLEEGQEVEVWVSGLRDDGKFGVSMIEGRLDGAPGGRRKLTDLTAFESFPPEDWLEGFVRSVLPFGAFVTITLPSGESADGLVHVSQLRDGFVEDVASEVEVGQQVKVRIMSVDLEKGKMSLSMKTGFGSGAPAARVPVDLAAFEGISSDQWLTGKVARVADFGAFVTVTAPAGEATADGLVHITQIKDGFVDSVADELQMNQEVQVRIQSVDVMGGKMSLTMKEGY